MNEPELDIYADPYAKFINVATALALELRAAIETNDPDYINAKPLLENVELWINRAERKCLEGGTDSNLWPGCEFNFGKAKEKYNELEYIFRAKIRRLPPPYPPL